MGMCIERQFETTFTPKQMSPRIEQATRILLNQAAHANLGTAYRRGS